MSGPEKSRSALFPSRAERARWDDLLTRALADADARLAEGSVVPTFDRATFRRELDAFDFAEPRALEQVLPWTIAQMEHGLVHLTHPRYFGLFNPAPTFPAQCADRIAAVFNPQLATSTTSPAAVEIEAHVIRAVVRRAGLPTHATGHFTTGGSEANYTALIAALVNADPRFAADGARAFAGPPVFYVSRDCHLAWIKIALMAGIGRSAVRLVATDGAGRMDEEALERAIAADRAGGCVPVMVVATAGTTNAGMIDPLARCAASARRHALWFHVDAAWGGALIATERLHGVLAGLEAADSVTIDAHKWFATTMGCGMFLTARPELLSETFQTATTFMPSNRAGIDPYVTTVQWSRRFLGLRLFLSLAAAGWAGYAAHVERAVDLIAIAKEQLAARGWQIVNNSPLAVLCAVPPGQLGDPRGLVARVVGSGRAWVAAASFEGGDVVRICVTHGETTRDDIAALIDALNR
jgi:glutamate/tyrosine decarboxylase-like PLP-dependent enzyme